MNIKHEAAKHGDLDPEQLKLYGIAFGDGLRYRMMMMEKFHKAFHIPINDGEIVTVSQDRHRLHFNLLIEEVIEFFNAGHREDIVLVADALADIRFVLDSIILEYGFHPMFNDLMDEVHRANMSKVDSDGNVEYRRNDGKITTRGKHYSPPDVGGLIEEYNISFLPNKSET